MVDRLKADPFALLGINSDGDRDVSSKLSEEEKKAVQGIAKSENQGLEMIRSGDPAAIAKLGAAATAIQKKIFDADLENLGKILEKNKIGWRQAVLGTTGGALARRWNIQGWPTIFVVDAKGVIRFRDLRGEELESAVVALIQEAKEAKGH